MAGIGPRATARGPLGWIEDHWFALLVVLSVGLLTAAAVGRFVLEPFYVSTDSALFQHAGWWITRGATPYVDFWDLKPPLIYGVTTLLALLTGGNMAALHVASVAVASAAVAGGVVLLGVLGTRLFGDGLAGLVAGASAFVVPSIYLFPSAGIRPKYFAFLFGTASLLLAVSDRPTWSGVAAAIGAGFWQLAGPLALLVVAIGWQRGGTRAAARAVLGGLAVAVAVVAPFVLAGLGVPLFVETVLAPVYGVERYTVPGRLLEAVLELGYGVAIVPLAVLGWAWAARVDLARYWWVGAGGISYFLLVFLEFQGAIEVILLVPFLGLGVGALVANTSTPSRRTIVAALVVVLAAGSLYWAWSPDVPGKATVEERYEGHAVPNYESLPARPDDAPSMQTIYWEQREPGLCHYRFGQKQRYFAMRTGESLRQSTCGEWPYEEPPIEWIVERLAR